MDNRYTLKEQRRISLPMQYFQKKVQISTVLKKLEDQGLFQKDKELVTEIIKANPAQKLKHQIKV